MVATQSGIPTIVTRVKEKKVNRARTVDLSGHHAQCEMNFHQFLCLLPGLRDGTNNWSFVAGQAPTGFTINIAVVESAPYTTTLSVEQEHNVVETPRIVVRLYHDVGMAEIVSWDHHRHWKPHYNYPNTHMYHPDEKLALNQFLGDWLRFCRKQGLQPTRSVIQFT